MLFLGKKSASTKKITAPSNKKEDLEEILKRKSSKTVYVPTTYGAMKVRFENYLYTHHYTRNRIARYRCDSFEKLKCPAAIIVKESKTYPSTLAKHNHSA